MKTRYIALCLTLLCLAGTVGCYKTVEGRSRMGVPFSKDRISSRYERSADQVFGAAKQVLGFDGTLTAENTVSRTLEAKIDNNTVGIKVEEVEPGVSQVIVQARKQGGTSNIELASEIDKRIALQLR